MEHRLKDNDREAKIWSVQVVDGVLIVEVEGKQVLLAYDSGNVHVWKGSFEKAGLKLIVNS